MSNPSREKQSVALVDSLINISKFLHRRGNQMVARSGLNQSHFTVLKEISERGNLTQKDILGEHLLQKSNLSKIIKKLESLGYIDLQTSQADARQTVLNATDAGRRLLKSCLSDLNSLKGQFTYGLNDDELAQIVPAIQKLEDYVTAQSKSQVRRTESMSS